MLLGVVRECALAVCVALVYAQEQREREPPNAVGLLLCAGRDGGVSVLRKLLSIDLSKLVCSHVTRQSLGRGR